MEAWLKQAARNYLPAKQVLPAVILLERHLVVAMGFAQTSLFVRVTKLLETTVIMIANVKLSIANFLDATN